MNRFASINVALLACAAALPPAASALPGPEGEAAIRIVIVTGVDWPGHLWKETAPALKDVLEKDKRFQVTIVEDLGFLASDKLFEFDEAVLHFKNYDPLPQEEKAKANLVKFVEEGRGLVVIHYASGALENWPEFRNLVGRTQGKRHDKRGPFTVKIVNPKHPITESMQDFQADDELFIELTGERPIEVLATAKSNITGQDHPMAFVLNYGKGRVFHTTLGHDAKAIRVSGTAELIRRGAAWAAGCGVKRPAEAVAPGVPGPGTSPPAGQPALDSAKGTD
jgi:type 1 glutamine amidotransferase